MAAFETDNPEMALYQNVLLLAEPKAGKTLYAATADRDIRKIFWLCADRGGYTTLIANGLEPPVRFIEPGDPYESAMDIIEDLRTAIGKKEVPYTAIVVDDIVSLQRQVKMWIMETAGDEIITRAGKLDMRAVYGKLLRAMNNIIGKLEGFPAHVIYPSWLKAASDDGKKLGGAMLEGQFKEYLEGACNASILLHLAKRVDDGEAYFEREVIVESWGGYNIGNRLRLPNPFPYDLELGKPGEPPSWEVGLAGLLNWQWQKKKKKSTRKKK